MSSEAFILIIQQGPVEGPQTWAAGSGGLEDASLQQILPAGAEDLHLHYAWSCELQAPSQSPEHSPAPSCTPSTHTLAPAISLGNQVPMRVPGVPLTTHYSHGCS